jgi:hypothetical protein
MLAHLSDPTQGLRGKKGINKGEKVQNNRREGRKRLTNKLQIKI